MERPMNGMMILLLLALCVSSARTASGSQEKAKTAPSNQIEQNSAEQNPGRQRRDGAITGRVIGPDGQPVADARVFAYRIGEDPGSPYSVAVADDGSFKLTGLEPGIYNVEVAALGYVSAETAGGNDIHRVGENLTAALIRGGVITGRVTDEAGEPIVGVGVRLGRLRDPEGRTIGSGEDTFEYHFGMTDDRGIYRVFGLRPGVYIANIGSGNSADDSQIRGDSPTYYPSAARDTAAEINLRGDEEVSGVDIRHRGDRGRIVSGSVSGEVASSSSNSVSVSLRGFDGGREADTSTSSARGFAFYGVPDGDYELVATSWGGSNETSGSGRRRVSVKGADVNGVELKLEPNGSISGRVIIETSTMPGRCEIKDDPAENLGAGQIQEQSTRRPVVEEILLIVDPDDSDQRAQTPRFSRRDGDAVPPNKKGEFAFEGLEAGRYRITADLPDGGWRIRAITRSVAGTVKRSAGATAAKSHVEVSRDGLTIKPGEKLSGVEVVVAEDAATLSGRVVTAKPASGAAKPTSPLRAYLTPAEAASADDVIRYAETDVRGDGSFEFKHVAPGKYLLHARQAAEKEAGNGQTGPLAWDAVERAKLRREAAAAKNEIELKACERVKEHVLRWQP
jgi:hypothetical protein